MIELLSFERGVIVGIVWHDSASFGRYAFAGDDNAYEAFNLLCKMT